MGARFSRFSCFRWLYSSPACYCCYFVFNQGYSRKESIEIKRPYYKLQYIHVKVTAGVKKESFVQKTEDSFEVSVREKAERNMANARVIELVAEHFKISLKKVRIVNGHRHPSKLLVIE